MTLSGSIVAVEDLCEVPVTGLTTDFAVLCRFRQLVEISDEMTRRHE
jgi:hypothetical protein